MATKGLEPEAPNTCLIRINEYIDIVLLLLFHTDTHTHPYCDALHVQLFQMKHTAQDGLLVPCLQGYRIPIQGELRKETQLSKAG